MIHTANPIQQILVKATNKRISIYLVDTDEFHRETKVMVATEVDARVVSQPASSRAYNPDKNFAVDVNEILDVYVMVPRDGEYLFSKIRIKDVVEIDGEEYRIVDIYRGYDIKGNLLFLRLTVA